MVEGKKVAIGGNVSASDNPTTALSNPLSQSRLGIASLANHNTYEWIIDSRANKHVADSFKIFLTYSPCLTQDHIRIADGSYTPIQAISSVNCTPNITLSFVLHVLGFPVNLSSLSALTISLNYKV